MTNPDNVGGLPATGPFVDRLIRIFRDKPHDDTSALVLLEYGELCRAAPAGGDPTRGKIDPSWSLFDRVDFALRDAGFDLDEAANIAALASGSAPAGSGEELAKWVEGARDYVTGGNVRPDDGDEDQEQWDRLTEAAALLRKLQQGAE